MSLDLLIKSGTVYDGTGAPGFPADVGVEDGRIVLVGQVEAEAAQTIDASGLAVAPGFIDLHTHSDLSFLVDPAADSKVRQGVTLELTGNCGMSLGAPLQGEAVRMFGERLALYGLAWKPDWTSFGEYLERLQKIGAVLNQATQVGHGSVRAAVLGFADRAPTPAELDTMRALVAEALDAGALGLSTGLYYAPGSYARTDEVVELAKEAARRGKLYSSHIRDEGDTSVSLWHAVEEAIAIGRMSGVRVQVSHLKCISAARGRAAELLERLERARREGIDAAGDQYPYTATSTSLTGALFPRWSLAGGRQATLEGVKNAAWAARLEAGIREGFGRRGPPEQVVIANFPPDRSLEGLTLAQAAVKLGVDPARAAIKLYQQGEASVVTHVLEERDVEVIAAHPLAAVGSDGSSLKQEGPLSTGKPHPRNYGTFPRFLARYQRERKLVSLAEAVRKMTLLPASRLGLTRRGRVAPGYWADLVCFDPQRAQDTATFEAPHQYPQGIPHVVVNGVPVVRSGESTGKTPGRVLKKFDD
ncbi:MAG: D-aminoacylase [Chloroflexi bacterium]|nr:D-aminoacylase [Chloroflexota bacterium]